MEQKKKSELTRNKILEAAETEFSALGLAAARVDSIANAAGVNKQMIYAHFSSKEGLYSAVLSRVYARLIALHERISTLPFGGMDALRYIIEENFRFLLNDPSFVRLMLWENLNGARYLEAAQVVPFGALRTLLNRGICDGEIRADIDVEQTLLSLNMFCFSAFSNVHTLSKLVGKDLTTKEELSARAAHITDVFLRYIRS